MHHHHDNNCILGEKILRFDKIKSEKFLEKTHFVNNI